MSSVNYIVITSYYPPWPYKVNDTKAYPSAFLNCPSSVHHSAIFVTKIGSFHRKTLNPTTWETTEAIASTQSMDSLMKTKRNFQQNMFFKSSHNKLDVKLFHVCQSQRWKAVRSADLHNARQRYASSVANAIIQDKQANIFDFLT